MNFDDYDNHILQKYRLALGIAIIKNTPEGLTPKRYLELIRSNIVSDMTSDDPDATISEEDFNLNDEENVNYTLNNKHEKQITDDNGNNETQYIHSQMNDSMTILKDFDFNALIKNTHNNDGTDLMETDSVSDILNILKGVDNKKVVQTKIALGDDSNLNQTQSTYYDGSQSQYQQQNDSINQNLGQIQKDDQELSNKIKYLQYQTNDEVNETVIMVKKTSVDSSGKATCYDSQKSNTSQLYTDNLTHVSQSQFNNIVLPKYLLEKENPNHRKSNLPSKEVSSNINKVLKHIVGTDKKTDTNIKVEKKQKQVNDKKNHKYATQGNIDNVQAKRLKTCNDNLNSNTDIAYFNEIKSKFNVIANTDCEFKLKYADTGPTAPIKEMFSNPHNVVNDSLHHVNKKIETHINQGRKKIENDTTICSDDFKSQNSVESSNTIYKIAFSNQTCSKLSPNNDFEPSNNRETVFNAISNNSTKQITITEINDENNDIQLESLFDKLSDSQTEVVPFKVVEELNNIKTFLTKKDRRNSSGCASDSGYKSDSQSRSSLKNGLLSSNISVNQSAFCLLTFIKQSPLSVNTQEITNEISRALGRLVDRLHEEEKYPPFLEEHLQTVDTLIKNIYEEDSDCNKLLKKDENIHRLFLLNKSSHIMKYTTEKIVAILEDVLTRLIEGEMIESTQTIRIENLSYIFHILETFIKKLIVHKNLSSQHSTQNSQEDEGIFKKSSLTDIWRKKWNSVKKSEQDALGSVKQCVLVRCSGVLNKIIVQAMDGYSLIAYFALQCFNLLQN